MHFIVSTSQEYALPSPFALKKQVPALLIASPFVSGTSDTEPRPSFSWGGTAVPRSLGFDPWVVREATSHALMESSDPVMTTLFFHNATLKMEQSCSLRANGQMCASAASGGGVGNSSLHHHSPLVPSSD